jgi:hypothetical protein
MLQDLIGCEKAKRMFAANSLSELHFSNDGQINEAMKAENFPINKYTADLINWMLHATNEQIAAFKREQAELNSLSIDELIQSFSDPSPETTEQHEWLMATVACAFVFEHLGDSILSTEKEGLKMLSCKTNSLYILNSINYLGGKAHIWASWFFDTLDGPEILNHDFFTAFASIARGDIPTLSRLCALLTSSENLKKIKVIRVLGDVGPVVKSNPTVVPTLRKLISLGMARLADKEKDPIYVSILSLAKITCCTDESIQLFINLSYDSNIYIQGMAISALGEVNYPSPEIVIRLGELFDSFEEFDPDMAYEGDKGRVANAVEKQGALAAPLVPQLINHVKDSFGYVDISVVRALGAIGPKAISALPHLKLLTIDFDDDDLADENSPIIKSIRSIEAQTN